MPTKQHKPEYLFARRSEPFQFSLRLLLAVPPWLALLLGLIAWQGYVGAALFVLGNCLAFLLLVPPKANDPGPFRRVYVLWVFGWGIASFFVVAGFPMMSAAWLVLTFWVSVMLMMMGFSLLSSHWFCAGIALLSIMVLCMSPFEHLSKTPSRRSTCVNNLRQIGLALHNYHDDYSSFPPAYVADETGRPLYSWRVLLLPYLDRMDLCKAWSFDEPWDSPANTRIAKTRLDLFTCPSSGVNSANPLCNYLAVAGPETIWPGSESRSVADIADGVDSTILLVEVRDTGVHWAEPRDLSVDQMAPNVNPEAGQGISSDHLDGACVLFADGHVGFMPSRASKEQVRAALTIAGSEQVEEW